MQCVYIIYAISIYNTPTLLVTVSDSHNKTQLENPELKSELVSVESLLTQKEIDNIKGSKGVFVIALQDEQKKFKGFYTLDSQVNKHLGAVKDECGQILKRKIATGG